MKNQVFLHQPASRPVFSADTRKKSWIISAALLSASLSLSAVPVNPDGVIREPGPAVINLSSLDGANGFVLNGITAGNNSGLSVCDAGDVNGDGIDDLIIGANGAASSAGESYVVYGSSTGFPAVLELSTLDGMNGFVLNGIGAGDNSGCSVSGAGDVNDDGLADVVIGANSAPSPYDKRGQSYVVFGSSNSVSASRDLSALNGTDGFTLNGFSIYDSVGTSVGGAGDVNGDGIDDLIIGAPQMPPYGAPSGESYVVFGSSTGFPVSLLLTSLNGANGFVLDGIGGKDRAGFSVSGAGDVVG